MKQSNNMHEHVCYTVSYKLCHLFVQILSQESERLCTHGSGYLISYYF